MISHAAQVVLTCQQIPARLDLGERRVLTAIPHWAGETWKVRNSRYDFDMSSSRLLGIFRPMTTQLHSHQTQSQFDQQMDHLTSLDLLHPLLAFVLLLFPGRCVALGPWLFGLSSKDQLLRHATPPWFVSDRIIACMHGNVLDYHQKLCIKDPRPNEGPFSTIFSSRRPDFLVHLTRFSRLAFEACCCLIFKLASLMLRSLTCDSRSGGFVQETLTMIFTSRIK